MWTINTCPASSLHLCFNLLASSEETSEKHTCLPGKSIQMKRKPILIRPVRTSVLLSHLAGLWLSKLFLMSPAAAAFPASLSGGSVLFLSRLTGSHVFRSFSCGVQKRPNERCLFESSWMPDLVAARVFSTGVVGSSDWQEGKKMATESKNTSACVFQQFWTLRLSYVWWFYPTR